MPASLVVQLVLWPETLADWARAESLTPALVYNALARFKPYHRVRDRLAQRLDVPKRVLDHLIDARRPLPTARRPPVPPDARGRGWHRWEGSPGSRLGDASSLPAVRDGSSPLERKALYRLELDIAALPASMVVQLALWPDTLVDWARVEALSAPLVYAVLAGSDRNDAVITRLARRLSVPPSVLRRLIEAERPEPSARRVPVDDAPPQGSHPPDIAAPGPCPASATPQLELPF
ncbi:MAG TPA: hypothetical protein VNK43_02990 [Gemmatimonadales bacterium]|nr:hypothetical protein [Gemmatimonadales bacterium]